MFLLQLGSGSTVSVRAVAVIVMVLNLLRPVNADEFYGINAGAPIWNGVIQLTPQEASDIAATGTDSVRINFRLDAGATSWNATQLNSYDQIIQNARDAGLKVLGLFSNETVAGGQAAWNSDPNGNGLNTYVSNFASTAELLVDRYKNDIKQWEVWNEPDAWTNPNYVNDPQNAGGTYILPNVYSQLLSQTYRQLNTGGQTLLNDHNISLATGGLLAHDIGGSFTTGMGYFQDVYDQPSVWNSFQADTGINYPWADFGYHFYISQGSLVSESQLANYFNAVRNTKAANNDLSDIVVTEFGWQTVGANTEELQRDNMATAYDYLEAQSDVSGTYWYQWEDDPGENWGILYGNGAQKLSYQEFAARNQTSTGFVTTQTEHALTDAALSLAYDNSDLLAGKIATERPGDLGWHSANPANSNGSLDVNGLPAFTDGVGDLGTGVTGLLNDFPSSGAPAKLLEYDLGGPHRIDEIRVFTGNGGNDGRIFSTTAVYTSTDGISFDLLGYFQSDPSGAVNNQSTPGGPDGATVVRIFRDDGTELASDVTHLRFDLFAVSDLDGVMRDPFSGTNSFNLQDDGIGLAFVSPLVRELDVLGVPQLADTADFDGDGDVDGLDFLTLQTGLGTTSGATLAEGDANHDGMINSADLAIWELQYGTAAPSIQTIPEPQAICLVLLSMTLGLSCRRLPVAGTGFEGR